MKKNIFTKLNEFLNNHDYNDMIVEMARINDKNKFNYDVFVNGGNSYGTGRNEHGEPHFHYSDNIKTPKKFSLSILIPTLNEWTENRELEICQTDDNNWNWEGLRKEKKDLIEWLDKINHKDKFRTNLEFIRLQWYVLNDDNKNVRKFND